MSTLRRPFRESIKQGTILLATVEAYKMGLATVRLAKTGARLTNLNVLGGTIHVGDTVIVDYTSGKPYVHPQLVVPEYDATRYPGTGKVEPIEIPGNEDYGVCVGNEPNGESSCIFVPESQPTLIPFGVNCDDETVHSIYWDTSSMAENSYYGSPYIKIPMTGIWLIHVTNNEFFQYFNGPYGLFRLRILSGSTILLEAMIRKDISYSNDHGINMSALVPLKAGDKVSMEYYFNERAINGGEWLLTYGFKYSWYVVRCLTLQYIPNSSSLVPTE